MSLLKDFEALCKYVRECTGDDIVCGLCEYDAGTAGEEPIECPGFESNECFVLKESLRKQYEMQGWIPRTEQEPNIGEHILITVLWEKGVDTTFDNDYEVMEEDWGVGEYEIKNRTAIPMVKRSHERMIAWMPMPKPYMAERKEE